MVVRSSVHTVRNRRRKQQRAMAGNANEPCAAAGPAGPGPGAPAPDGSSCRSLPPLPALLLERSTLRFDPLPLQRGVEQLLRSELAECVGSFADDNKGGQRTDAAAVDSNRGGEVGRLTPLDSFQVDVKTARRPNKQRALTEAVLNAKPFLEAYERVVREVCVPHLLELFTAAMAAAPAAPLGTDGDVAAATEQLGAASSIGAPPSAHAAPSDDGGEESAAVASARAPEDNAPAPPPVAPAAVPSPPDAVGTQPELPREFFYQFPPTLRVQPGPSDFSVKAHTDAEYGHQAGEVNFWCPLTAYKKTQTTLWLESAPGKLDYAPMEVDLGEIGMFHGTSLMHTVPGNPTPHTRVSIDFRIGFGGYFDAEWEKPGTVNDHTRRRIVLDGL